MPVTKAPRKRMYRTMQGRMVDIEKLRGANESTQAVGNMNVNARGDVLGPGGTIIKPKEKVMKEYYETPKGRAEDTPRVKVPPQPRQMPTPKPVAAKPAPVKTMAPQPATPTTAPKKIDAFKPKATKSGIDAALDGIE